ncbi:hypothetical protein ACFL1X_08530, partial [Candidatus Hydrogenedentota bacterium]
MFTLTFADEEFHTSDVKFYAKKAAILLLFAVAFFSLITLLIFPYEMIIWNQLTKLTGDAKISLNKEEMNFRLPSTVKFKRLEMHPQPGVMAAFNRPELGMVEGMLASGLEFAPLKISVGIFPLIFGKKLSVDIEGELLATHDENTRYKIDARIVQDDDDVLFDNVMLKGEGFDVTINGSVSLAGTLPENIDLVLTLGAPLGESSPHPILHELMANLGQLLPEKGKEADDYRLVVEPGKRKGYSPTVKFVRVEKSTADEGAAAKPGNESSAPAP